MKTFGVLKVFSQRTSNQILVLIVSLKLQICRFVILEQNSFIDKKLNTVSPATMIAILS